MKEYLLRNQRDRMRYHDFRGECTPILFLHGLGCAGSFDYPDVASNEALRGHRKILVDLLGAGYSDKPSDFPYTAQAHAQYLSEFVHDMGLERFVLFGHSLGGAIALSLADLCRDKVCAIILSEANLDSGGGFISGPIAAYGEEAFVADGFSKVIASNREASHHMWAASFSVYAPIAAYRLSKSAVEGQAPSWRDILYSLTCPKTFLFGEKSLPDPDMQALPANGVEVVIVKDAGHSMAWENPEGLAEAISLCLPGRQMMA